MPTVKLFASTIIHAFEEARSELSETVVFMDRKAETAERPVGRGRYSLLQCC